MRSIRTHEPGGAYGKVAAVISGGSCVVEIIKSGGWLMLPIILCSIVAIAIIIERFWTLSAARISPRYTLGQVWTWIKNNELNAARLRELRLASPLGQILAAGLVNSKYGRAAMTVSIEQAASQVIHDMERYLNTLGIIAAITPLLGLLGTVLGMIDVFTEIMIQGTGNANALAGGISQALITTAAGLCVAIPTYMFHRLFMRRVDTLVLNLEQESIKLVDALHSDRRVEVKEIGNP
ncbi:MAG: MotA/TolQ/ExbB proton channel family protein [Pseudomonadales bacterium]|nr:MotA/TolQ/ExbB proton channel family protein [Pseudomonadales bacterium]